MCFVLNFCQIHFCQMTPSDVAKYPYSLDFSIFSPTNQLNEQKSKMFLPSFQVGKIPVIILLYYKMKQSHKDDSFRKIFRVSQANLFIGCYHVSAAAVCWFSAGSFVLFCSINNLWKLKPNVCLGTQKSCKRHIKPACCKALSAIMMNEK